MNAGIDATLATQLLILSQSVQGANHEGDIEGLMCKFFISRLESDIAWRVTCANSLWIADNAKSLQQADFDSVTYYV